MFMSTFRHSNGMFGSIVKYFSSYNAFTALAKNNYVLKRRGPDKDKGHKRNQCKLMTCTLFVQQQQKNHNPKLLQHVAVSLKYKHILIIL